MQRRSSACSYEHPLLPGVRGGPADSLAKARDQVIGARVEIMVLGLKSNPTPQPGTHARIYARTGRPDQNVGGRRVVPNTIG
jgi:hypothetical protein